MVAIDIDSEIRDHFAQIPTDYVLEIEVDRLVTRLEKEHRAAFRKWLGQQARRTVHSIARERERAVRGQVRSRNAPSTVFGAAAESLANAQTEDEAAASVARLSVFASVFVVNEENLRRRVADMTGEDHVFVADRYQSSGNRDLMLAAFHRQVGKKVGFKRTEDVLDEATYLSLLESVDHAVSAAS